MNAVERYRNNKNFFLITNAPNNEGVIQVAEPTLWLTGCRCQHNLLRSFHLKVGHHWTLKVSHSDTISLLIEQPILLVIGSHQDLANRATIYNQNSWSICFKVSHRRTIIHKDSTSKLTMMSPGTSSIVISFSTKCM